ncbi:MarR family winged helix-turn-helix transcriptional regulator [Thermovenabulum gondwanense]|uniref:Putative HTH-type transcriptional regulator YusO n=1 Tax=Thermovenabulum gondwanense TaxID=520767 RepID=A0A162MY47_9FIRM|nr:MarR family transcriptional regulator [Thermovenabulum gondwanense]KYO68099.1 putative HTH-type transcriptional regulator YusO [Thermovenabulum gondwanense]
MLSDFEVAHKMEEFNYVMKKWTKKFLKKYFSAKNLEVTPNQYPLLFILKEHGPVKMKELSEHMNITTGSLTVMVDRLIEKKLVERFYMPEDRRVVMVGLTEKGNEELENFKKVFIDYILEGVKRLSEKEKNDLIYCLDFIKNVLIEYY